MPVVTTVKARSCPCADPRLHEHGTATETASKAHKANCTTGACKRALGPLVQQFGTLRNDHGLAETRTPIPLFDAPVLRIICSLHQGII